VAINKIDKESADIEHTILDLAQYDVNVEEIGGDVPCVPISAKEGTNIDLLEQTIIKLSESFELKDDINGPAKCFIIESNIDQKGQ
jgi:translation initiation factor IF-2